MFKQALHIIKTNEVAIFFLHKHFVNVRRHYFNSEIILHVIQSLDKKIIRIHIFICQDMNEIILHSV